MRRPLDGAGDKPAGQASSGDAVAHAEGAVTQAEDKQVLPSSGSPAGFPRRGKVDPDFVMETPPASSIDPHFFAETPPASSIDPNFFVDPPPSASAISGAASEADRTTGEGKTQEKAADPRPRMITKEALDFIFETARDQFVRFGSKEVAWMRVAKLGKQRLADVDGVIELLPGHEFDSYLNYRRNGKWVGRGATPETAEIAKLRREWEEAAASGDPDRMTRTANALIRAVEADRVRTGAHESAHTGGDSRALAGSGASRVLRGHALGDPAAAGAGQSNTNVGPGKIARAGDGRRTIAGLSFSDHGVGDGTGAHNKSGDRTALTDEPARLAASLVSRVSGARRGEVLGQLHERFGPEIVARIAEFLPQDAPSRELRIDKTSHDEAAHQSGDGSNTSGNRATYAEVGWTWNDVIQGIRRLLGLEEEAPEDPKNDAWIPEFDDPDNPAMGPEVWKEPETYPGGGCPPPTIDDPVNPVVPEHQPGAWRRAKKPQSHRGKVLIDARDLSEQQFENLTGRWNGRTWASPTGAPPAGYERLAGTSFYRGGYGYFGASRNDKDPARRYHGALDFPRNPNDPIVKMPTQARFLALSWDAENGYAVIVSLGDGIVLKLYHIIPSEELRELERTRQRTGRTGRILAIGHPLGVVDRKRDHVHMQIEVKGGRYNGEPVPGFVVDPTPFFR